MEDCGFVVGARGEVIRVPCGVHRVVLAKVIGRTQLEIAWMRRRAAIALRRNGVRTFR